MDNWLVQLGASWGGELSPRVQALHWPLLSRGKKENLVFSIEIISVWCVLKIKIKLLACARL